MTDLSPAYHYQVIARALNHIDEGGPSLTLDDLASRMNMSPAHFQRVFSQWVGVSPKRYQQYLALDHARRLLAERPDAIGLAVPGMPYGSPGMGPEDEREAYEVFLIRRDGSTEVFSAYPEV